MLYYNSVPEKIVREVIRKDWNVHVLYLLAPKDKYLLLTEFEVSTVSYGPSFFPLDLWPKREARGP